jgi:hypothetical protein
MRSVSIYGRKNMKKIYCASASPTLECTVPCETFNAGDPFVASAHQHHFASRASAHCAGEPDEGAKHVVPQERQDSLPDTVSARAATSRSSDMSPTAPV